MVDCSVRLAILELSLRRCEQGRRSLLPPAYAAAAASVKKKNGSHSTQFFLFADTRVTSIARTVLAVTAPGSTTSLLPAH